MKLEFHKEELIMQENIKIKAYVTKYVLTQGILEVDAEICMNVSEDMLSYRGSGGFIEFCHGEGKEWHKTKEEAILRANKLRDTKINNIKKQIKKLEDMKFE